LTLLFSSPDFHLTLLQHRWLYRSGRIVDAFAKPLSLWLRSRLDNSAKNRQFGLKFCATGMLL
jgi:hypothetical protein